MKSKQTLLLTGILTVSFAIVGFFVSVRTASTITTNYDLESPMISSFRGFAQARGQPRYAIVHLIDRFTTIYETALLASLFRAVDIHSNISKAVFSGQLDLVVMHHEDLDLTGYEHPYIRYVPFNGDALKEALAGKKYPEWEVATHYKLCAMNLVEYDKVVFVDLDYVLRAQLASILLETTPPAMVQWGEYPQLDFNSGFHILRPSAEMFNDAVTALKKIGHYYAATEELQDVSMFHNLQKHVPSDPSPWAGYRSDQEFTYAFYETLPETRHKWGPIHTLPYRYNAREESVSYNTARFLTRQTTIAKPKLTPPGVFDGAHLHLFGGFGQDGRGHRLNPIPKEDGMFGLVGVHFTTRKPWKEGRIHNRTLGTVRFEDHLANNLTLTPQERCPEHIYHVDFWEGVINGMMKAMTDRRYGFLWMTDSIFEYVQKHLIVQRCFGVEFEALKKKKKEIENSSTKDCPDLSDCQNKHCRSRKSKEQCTQTSPPPFIPLIKKNT
jgi:hypothetical protein